MTAFRAWNRSTRKLTLLIGVVLLAATTAADAQLLGGLSEDDEIELGRLTAEEIEKDLDLLTDDIVTAYVSELGTSLAGSSERSHIVYTFKVVNTADINAFALPGGFIYVNRGLIEATDTENELAGVLGHEIGHVVARHGAEQAQRASIANAGLRVLDSIFGGGTAGRLGSMAAQMATAGTFMTFSREAEREADQLGAVNVAVGGHNPEGMITFFEKLGALRQGQANVVETFFASHPDPAERVANIQNLVSSLNGDPDLTDDSPRFREVRDRLRNMPAPPTDTGPATDEASEAVGGAESAAETASVEVELPTTYSGMDSDYSVAAFYAPVFRQAMGESARYDYVTRFDFDGDWVGDNNWDNARDEGHPLPAMVYFNLTQTYTHYLIHYAVFHPRDYKGGDATGAALSELIREGVGRFGNYDPTGLAESAVLAHENDMEGALVVAERTATGGPVVYVETLAHNQFLQYRPSQNLAGILGRWSDSEVQLEGNHPVLFIEPKGHGVEAYHGGEQIAEDVRGFLIYRFAGEAGLATASEGEQVVGYDLVPMATTLWPRALDGENQTYGGAFDYGSWTLDLIGGARDFELGTLGSMFRGGVGGQNMARPPWGWFDADETDRRQGEWFLTPAETIKRHFNLGDSFSTVYMHHPVLGIYRD